ncbi:hypothetical protein AMATHDRAFT_60844 [Amanita thiersii Skay4041]|uniref:Uncharacterized protein n=1 Tax=Amanita thiersii Skay4041 TaxID=703135 RepID=A0A2A9NQN6_9AGAR|nr:hypothetical protein AMATHDRAFT_60844 [Amanita thiersii Skay4041]
MNTNVLRQGGMPPNTSMLGLGNPTFMQNPPQSAQQPLSQSHMGLSSSAANSNSPMAMLAGNPQNPRYLPIQQSANIQQHQPPQQQQQHRIPMMRPAPGAQHMNPPSAPQIAGLGPNQLFPPGNIQPAGSNLGPRRGPSQPQGLNPAAGHIAGLSSNNMNISMNPQNAMPGHLRPGQQQPQRIQPSMAGVSPDIAMAMSRQGSGNPGIPQTLTRTASAQALMGGLNQPPQMGQVALPPGMQPTHQTNFQNPAQMPNQVPISSPRPGSHPPTHPPNMTMGTPGPSHTPVGRTQMTPDSALFGIGFPNSQFSQGPTGNRLPNNGGTPTRPGFQPTPAQQLEMMNGTNDFTSPFNMPPPRPPSQHNPHSSSHPQQQPPFQPSLHQHSPHQNDPLAGHPQRPASQPQQSIPGRPPSQTGPRTPSQTPLSVNATVANTRIPVNHGAPPPSHPTIGPGPVSIAPRPTQQPIAPSGPPGPAPPLPAPDAPAPSAMSIATSANIAQPVGTGQGLMRLLQFSGLLASESPKKLHLSWWEEFVKEYFTPSAIMKITLWKDSLRAEAKPFDIGVPILPRFFLVTTQSGVKSMTLSLDGARERMYAREPRHSVVECLTAVWTYKYNNGYTVTLRGPLTAHVVATAPTPGSDAYSVFHTGQRHLKFDNLSFEADHHDKYILLDTVMTNGTSIQQQQQQQDEEKKWEEPKILIERSLIPGEPVNAFGIPQATMRCLELAESVGQMSDLIVYSTENKLGPLEALKKFAAQIRESQNYGPFNSTLSTGNSTSNPPNSFAPFVATNGTVPMNLGGTLYSSAPPSVTNPQANSAPGSSITSPQNTTVSASNSPQKQHKTIPQQQSQSQGSAASSSAPAASPSVSSGATNTPHMANSTLKRKQASETASPTISNADGPPTKRQARKRGRTTGGG